MMTVCSAEAHAPIATAKPYRNATSATSDCQRGIVTSTRIGVDKNDAFSNSIPSQWVCVGKSARRQSVAAANVRPLTRAGHVSASLILRRP